MFYKWENRDFHFWEDGLALLFLISPDKNKKNPKTLQIEQTLWTVKKWDRQAMKLSIQVTALVVDCLDFFFFFSFSSYEANETETQKYQEQKPKKAPVEVCSL